MAPEPLKLDAVSNRPPNVAAVVVTHNRKDLLLQCLASLLHQSTPCSIVIFDNASSDGTAGALEREGLLSHPTVSYERSEENLGGAGGFRRGLMFAMSQNREWFWLMDDDAVPEKDALEKLCAFALGPDRVCGSVAVGKEKTQTLLCWPAFPLRRRIKKLLLTPEMLREPEEVNVLPFIGFLLHRQLVDRIGYPDERFFISGDDVEYCERAKRSGARIFQIKSSRIHHPVARRHVYRLGSLEIFYRQLPAWKVYYEVRNKIVIAKKYYGSRLWTRTLPGIFIRALCGLNMENEAGALLRAYVLAVSDGLRGKLGKRSSLHPR